jgi:predicted nuclease of predicted toxin-antitoxin system
MPPANFRLLADENIELDIVTQLQNMGYDIRWLVTFKPGLMDDLIPALMTEEGRILLTYDVDFVSSLHLSGRTHTGAVLIRVKHSSYDWITSAIHKTLNERKNWIGRIAVIKANGVRFTPHE